MEGGHLPEVVAHRNSTVYNSTSAKTLYIAIERMRVRLTDNSCPLHCASCRSTINFFSLHFRYII